LIARALAVASPTLLTAIKNIQQQKKATRRNRVYSRLLRYIVRMSTRPTPFGLFAGVGRGTLEDQAAIQLAPSSAWQSRTRIDMNWHIELIRYIEQNQKFRSSLNVIANQNTIVGTSQIF
jgi:hypothetical protein